MDKSIFNIRPQFEGIEGKEPSLEEVLYHYYRYHFDANKSYELTNEYMRILLNELQKMEKER